MPTWSPAASTCVMADSVALERGLSQDRRTARTSSSSAPATPTRNGLGDGAGIAIRKGDTDLRQAFNAAIDKIRADGTYEKINAKYFDFDVYGSRPVGAARRDAAAPVA